MSISENQLAAFADGELEGAERERVARAVAADPLLMAKAEQHRQLRQQLSSHFAQVLDQPLPETLTSALQPADNVVDMAGPRARLGKARSIPVWGWAAGSALAASLVLAVFLPRAGDGQVGYAGSTLASALDNQLVATQTAAAETRILLSFRDAGGEYCRAFASTDASGIACRDNSGWRLVDQQGGVMASGTDYRTAGNPVADLLARAQEMAAGGALDSSGERAAREAGWQDQ